MRFRPCIDIHNGKVKQIVGGSLSDKGSTACENFVSGEDGAFYGRLYKSRGLYGGHVIILNPQSSEYYEEDKKQAFAALDAFPGGLQIGGGVTADNAGEYIDRGASHVIVTSYIFKDGRVSFDRLEKLCLAAGREHTVLDLSCRARDGEYFIVTDRWQRFTDTRFNEENILALSEYCDEFLVHAVDCEGRQRGIERKAAEILANVPGIKAVYAGGISSPTDIETLRDISGGRLDFTVGSALSIFGGSLDFEIISKIK